MAHLVDKLKNIFGYGNNQDDELLKFLDKNFTVHWDPKIQKAEMAFLGEEYSETEEQYAYRKKNPGFAHIHGNIASRSEKFEKLRREGLKDITTDEFIIRNTTKKPVVHCPIVVVPTDDKHKENKRIIEQLFKKYPAKHVNMAITRKKMQQTNR